MRLPPVINAILLSDAINCLRLGRPDLGMRVTGFHVGEAQKSPLESGLLIGCGGRI